MPEPSAEIDDAAWDFLEGAGLPCACVHWDARSCLRGRNPDGLFDPEGEAGYDDDERCECACHDIDRPDDH